MTKEGLESLMHEDYNFPSEEDKQVFLGLVYHFKHRIIQYEKETGIKDYKIVSVAERFGEKELYFDFVKMFFLYRKRK